MNVQQAIVKASAYIARRDAETLLLHTLRHEHRDRAWLLAHPEALLQPAEAAAFFALVSRRKDHTPVQYLTGHQEFFGLDLHVTPDTLIPRPETELLVEAVLTWAAAQAAPGTDRNTLNIVDVGTGTGAIAIALAAHLPSAHLWAVDLSPQTRPVVEVNARRHHVERRVDFIESDLLAHFGPRLSQGLRFDAVVSNPPYVSESDAPTLEPQVRDFEPHSALFAGPDGLAIYRRLIPQARHALRPGGLLALEFGFGQRDALASLLSDWNSVRFLDDLAGIPRVALAERPSGA